MPKKVPRTYVIPEEVVKEFNKHCDKQGYEYSKRVAILMQKDINEAK